jgi:outer membrane protein
VQHAQNAREDTRQLMRVDIETKWSNLSEAYLQIDLARRSVASAAENLRLNHDSYEAGTVPLTDLLDAQTLLRLARDRYTEACTAYCNARTAYRQAVGEQGARIVPELSQFLCRRI